MKNRRIIIGIMLLVLSACIGGCVNQYPQERRDEEISIVATSVTICEILDGLEVDNVIGVPKTEAYNIPKRYQDKQTVGMPMNPDIEIITSLQPTYIMSPESLKGDLLPKYENANLGSYFLDLSSVEGMYRSITEIGEMLGVQEQADKLEKEFDIYIAKYNEQTQEAKKVKVLVLMGLPGSYVAATEKSYVGSLVEMAGGENVYQADEAFLNINPEDMLEKNPDVILLTSHALPEQVEQMFKDEFEENDVWKHFQAVKNQRVHTLNHQYFGMSANFRYREALTELKEILYEEKY